MKEIDKPDALYTLIRHYMSFRFPTAYSTVNINGQENIPKDGAIIFAPNHTNSLMDALTVLMVDRCATVFVAKASLFRNPLAAKAMHFFRIMPMVRARDGIKAVEADRQVIERSAQVLKNGMPFAIFPEGTDRQMHSLMPLGKGVFRVAIGADEILKGEKKVYIVPLGINYGSFVRYGGSLSVHVGKPIDITAFRADNSTLTDQEMMAKLRPILWNAIKEQIHYLPDDEHYQGSEDICYLLNNEVKKELNLPDSPYGTTLANKHIASLIAKLREEEPQKAEELLALADKFASLRRANNIDDTIIYDAIEHKHNTPLKNLFTISWLVLAIPYILFSLLVDWPSIVAGYYFQRKKVDDGLINSLRFGCDLTLSWIIWLLIFVVVCITTKWYIALTTLFLAIPATPFLHYVYKRVRLIREGARFYKNKELQADLTQLVETLKEVEFKKG